MCSHIRNSIPRLAFAFPRLLLPFSPVLIALAFHGVGFNFFCLLVSPCGRLSIVASICAVASYALAIFHANNRKPAKRGESNSLSTINRCAETSKPWTHWCNETLSPVWLFATTQNTHEHDAYFPLQRGSCRAKRAMNNNDLAYEIPHHRMPGYRARCLFWWLRHQ